MAAVTVVERLRGNVEKPSGGIAREESGESRARQHVARSRNRRHGASACVEGEALNRLRIEGLITNFAGALLALFPPPLDPLPLALPVPELLVPPEPACGSSRSSGIGSPRVRPASTVCARI